MMNMNIERVRWISNSKIQWPDGCQLLYSGNDKQHEGEMAFALVIDNNKELV